MTGNATDSHEANDAEDTWDGLTAEVVERTGEPARCTIYPRDVDPGLALTTWVLARGDAFVGLDEMR